MKCPSDQGGREREGEGGRGREREGGQFGVSVLLFRSIISRSIATDSGQKRI